MELEFKPDFEQVQQRWDRFWCGEHTDRPITRIIAPKSGVEPIDKPPYTAGYDGNYEPVIEQVLAYARTHEFIGEAIPFFYLEFGADHFASLLGGDLRFPEDYAGNSWAVPVIDDWDRTEIRFQPEGKWWRRTREFIQAARAKFDGRVMIASPTLSAGLDALAALRGTERLLVDMIEQPERVHAAVAAVNRAYDDVLDALAVELDYDRFGSINRHGMYSTGRVAVPQCDFSCMVSPTMFDEFEIPALTHECSRLDAVEYHLDGPGALKHLPSLCRLERLHVVQWVPGDGAGEQQDWTELYYRIDALGKGQILGGSVERIRQFWREFQSRRLFYSTGADTLDDGLRKLDAL